MSDLDSKEPVSIVNEDSFVILGHGSLPSGNQLQDEYQANKSNSDSLVNTENVNINFDLNESTSDTSKCFSGSSFLGENIQEKLNELAKENYQLKETLSQNNLAIKSQLDTFFMWQQEVLKTHEAHKEKFLETKDLILKLRNENINLKKQMEECSCGSSVFSDMDASKQTTPEHTDLSDKKEEIKSFEVIPNTVDKGNECLLNENQKLVTALEDAKMEISKLKKDMEALVEENLTLKQSIENVPKNLESVTTQKSLPNVEARIQISNLFKQLENEKSKVLKLKEALKKVESEKNESLNAQLSTTEELHQYIDQLSDMSHSLELQNQRFSGFNSWVTLAEANLEESQPSGGMNCSLMSEIKEFKNHLHVEESATKEKHESVRGLKKEFTRLLEDYKVLQEQWNSLKDESQKITKYKEEVSSLKEEVEILEKELLSKQLEYVRLREKLDSTKSEYEEKVHLLQFQVELYQTDFNSEREARERLAGEKEDMAEHVRCLLNEINRLRKRNPPENNDETSPLASPGKKTSYMCPKCLSSFRDLNDCVKHVDDCLDIHMYP